MSTYTITASSNSGFTASGGTFISVVQSDDTATFIRSTTAGHSAFYTLTRNSNPQKPILAIEVLIKACTESGTGQIQLSLTGTGEQFADAFTVSNSYQYYSASFPVDIDGIDPYPWTQINNSPISVYIGNSGPATIRVSYIQCRMKLKTNELTLPILKRSKL
jgi:hypothetical protein